MPLKFEDQSADSRNLLLTKRYGHTRFLLDFLQYSWHVWNQNPIFCISDSRSIKYNKELFLLISSIICDPKRYLLSFGFGWGRGLKKCFSTQRIAKSWFSSTSHTNRAYYMKLFCHLFEVIIFAYLSKRFFQMLLYFKFKIL